MPDIIHLTTVHPRTDTRIRIKQVSHLAKNLHYQVELFVADGLGDECDRLGNFGIRDIGVRHSSRLGRLIITGFKMFAATIRAKPKIVHFHDPELIPWCLLLRVFNIKVIYDAHEDLVHQVMHKEYLGFHTRKFLSIVLRYVELVSQKLFSGCVVVMPSMLERFDKSKAIVITNYPLLSEFEGIKPNGSDAFHYRAIYTGGLTRVRGLTEMLTSFQLIDDESVSLSLLGNFDTEDTKYAAIKHEGWKFVEHLGWCDRASVISELTRSDVGIVLLYPTPQYVLGYPVKMFEYMAAGLPVVASNFDNWKRIFTKYRCGLQVDPRQPTEISSAINWLRDNPEEARAMGERGREAVIQEFNWEIEGAKLLEFYERMLKPVKMR